MFVEAVALGAWAVLSGLACLWAWKTGEPASYEPRHGIRHWVDKPPREITSEMCREITPDQLQRIKMPLMRPEDLPWRAHDDHALPGD